MRPNCFKEGMEWCNKLFVTGLPARSVSNARSELLNQFWRTLVRFFSIHLQEIRIAVKRLFLSSKRE
jgi:hypothetical protein